jgi:G3E family GTPase
VIAVVSAKRWKGDSEKELFERQIVAANKVVLSFVDEVGQ